MKEVVVAVIAGVFSGAFFTFLQFLIQRKDSKKQDIEDIKEAIEDLKEKTKEIQLGNSRTELMLLFNDYPDNEGEVLKQAEKYFVQLGGDFYMTSMFTRWLKLNHISIPGWFVGGGE